MIYEQVLECIDLDALCRLEQSLAMMAGELEGVGPDKAGDMATAMLDRALLRLPADVRSYLRLAGLLSTSQGELGDESRPSAQSPAPPSPTPIPGGERLHAKSRLLFLLETWSNVLLARIDAAEQRMLDAIERAEQRIRLDRATP